MRVMLWVSAASALLSAGVAAVLLPPLFTPVTPENAEARLTLACRAFAFSFEQDTGEAAPEGSCACLVDALANQISSRRFAEEVEDARLMIIRSVRAEITGDQERARETERARKEMSDTAAILDPHRHARAARACQHVLSAAERGAPAPGPASSRT